MKRRIFALLSAVMLLAVTASGCAAGNAGDRSRKGTVRILTLYDVYDYASGDYLYQDAGVGTGFGVGQAGKETDVFVTNLHVVAESQLQQAEDGSVLAYQRSGVYILKDNFAFSFQLGLDASRAEPCNVIYGSDDNGVDIAILRTAKPVEGRVALPLLGSEDGLKIGHEVTALGYPFSSDQATSDGYLLASIDDVTVTSGKTSRFYEPASVSSGSGILDNNRFIQHTAAVNHGNSGGPLVDQNGNVAGVNTNIIQGSEYGETTAYYALRIQYVIDALDGLGIRDVTVRSGNTPLAVGIAAAAVVVVVVVLAIVMGKSRKKLGPVTDSTTEGGPVVPPPVQPQPASQPGTFRIQGQGGAFAGRRFSITGQTPGQVRIGTDPGKNDLVYPSTPGISRVHCVLVEQGGALYLRDLGSTYGTFLAGGQRLAANQPVQLKIGDRFYLGSEKEMFQVTGRGGV